MSTSPLDELLESTTPGADDEQGRKTTYVPGLPTLRAQQQELVDRLRDGFESREAIFMWTHAAAALSFGHVPDDWFVSLLRDRFRIAALLEDADKRDALTPHAPDADQAAVVRDSIQQTTLSEAFRQARADIRSSSSDHPEGQADPEQQRFLGMRPRLHEVAVEQHDVLQSTFLGFDSRRAILDWADHLDYATLGFLPAGIPSRVADPTSDWWAVLRSGKGGAWLQLRLAQTVLPACNEALRAAMQSGTEQPDTHRESSVPSG